MTDEKKQLYVSIATALFNTLLLLSGATFAKQYAEILLALASTVSICAFSFLGVKINRVIDEQARAEKFNAAMSEEVSKRIGDL